MLREYQRSFHRLIVFPTNVWMISNCAPTTVDGSLCVKQVPHVLKCFTGEHSHAQSVGSGGLFIFHCYQQLLAFSSSCVWSDQIFPHTMRSLFSYSAMFSESQSGQSWACGALKAVSLPEDVFYQNLAGVKPAGVDIYCLLLNHLFVSLEKYSVSALASTYTLLNSHSP